MTYIDVMKQALADMELIAERMGNWGAYASEYFQKKHRLDDDIVEADAAIERLSKAIEEAEKNQFNPDWNAVQLISEENLALHKRIAELEAGKVEPVAFRHWLKVDEEFFPQLTLMPRTESDEPLYTAPPQREWVGLTDEDMTALWSWSSSAEAERTASTQQHAFAYAIEVKLKEKNHIANVGKMIGESCDRA